MTNILPWLWITDCDSGGKPRCTPKDVMSRTRFLTVLALIWVVPGWLLTLVMRPASCVAFWCLASFGCQPVALGAGRVLGAQKADACWGQADPAVPGEDFYSWICLMD